MALQRSGWKTAIPETAPTPLAKPMTVTSRTHSQSARLSSCDMTIEERETTMDYRLIAVFLLSPAVFGQEARPRFEVASLNPTEDAKASRELET
jgi:hypothetical protein